MTTFFHEREEAAEAIYAHAEEARFDGRLRGVKALAAWSSRVCGRNEHMSEAYEQKLLGLLVRGSADETLLAKVMDDLPARDRQPLEALGRKAFVRAAGAGVLAP